GAVVSALLLSATPAWPHADLKSVTPADGAALKVQPESVAIEFTATIEDTVKEATLLPPSGKPIEDAWKADGSRITITVPAEPTPGTWGIQWRVLGGDGHPLTGSTTFVVGGSGEAAGAKPQSGTPATPSGG